VIKPALTHLHVWPLAPNESAPLAPGRFLITTMVVFLYAAEVVAQKHYIW